jgi:hypothetical protein
VKSIINQAACVERHLTANEKSDSAGSSGRVTRSLAQFMHIGNKEKEGEGERESCYSEREIRVTKERG